MSERLSTGVDVIDRRLRGGVPPGTLLTLASPPETGGEYLLYAALNEESGRYLSLLRPEEEIVDDVESHVVVNHARPSELLSNPASRFESLPERSVVVVDPVNELEMHDVDGYVTFLSELKRQLVETKSVGILHALHSESDPEHRWLTLGRADWVWHLDLVRLPLSVETRLYVTKARNGQALTEPLKLQLVDGVRVDTSRDI